MDLALPELAFLMLQARLTRRLNVLKAAERAGRRRAVFHLLNYVTQNEYVALSHGEVQDCSRVADYGLAFAEPALWPLLTSKHFPGVQGALG